MRKLVLVGLVALALVAASTARADRGPKGTTCDGLLTSVVVTGNLVVSASCTLDGTTVTGNVYVLPSASLTALGATIGGDLECDDQSSCYLSFDDAGTATTVGHNVTVGKLAYLNSAAAQIGGDVQCHGCNGADLNSTTVGGNVHSDGQVYAALYTDTAIAGDLQFSNDPAGIYAYGTLSVGGNLQLLHNGGAIDVFGFTIGGNLQLVGNVADQIDLEGNQVQHSIICNANRATQFSGSGNTARKIDPQCGPIGAPAAS